MQLVDYLTAMRSTPRLCHPHSSEHPISAYFRASISPSQYAAALQQLYNNSSSTMCNFKFIIAAVAILGAGVAVTTDIGNWAPRLTSSWSVTDVSTATCLTAPAVTTTVTITTCGQPTWPAVPTSEPNEHDTASSPSPAETSWLPSHPEPVPESHGPQAPGIPGSAASPFPAESDQPRPPPSGPSEEPSGGSGKPSGGSSGKPSGQSPPKASSTATDTITPSSTLSQTGGTPTKTPWAQPSEEPSSPTNAGSLVSMPREMGFFVAITMALSAGVAFLL